MSDEKLPILKPEELIKALKKMGFFVPENQRVATFGTNIRMAGRQRFPFTKAKTLAEAF